MEAEVGVGGGGNDQLKDIAFIFLTIMNYFFNLCNDQNSPCSCLHFFPARSQPIINKQAENEL